MKKEQDDMALGNTASGASQGPPSTADNRVRELHAALTEACGRYQGLHRRLLETGMISQQYHDESMAVAARWEAVLDKVVVGVSS